MQWFKFNPLSVNPTEWSNTLKHCLSVFDHFVGLVLKGLTLLKSMWHLLFTHCIFSFFRRLFFLMFFIGWRRHDKCRKRKHDKCSGFRLWRKKTFNCSKWTIGILEKICEICSKLTINTPSFFTVNFEHISHLFLVFSLFTLNK